MTQEDKELLLKDLCARLPYGVKAYVKHWSNLEWKYYENVYTVKSTFPSLNDVHVQSETGSVDVLLGHSDYVIKPYFFPLESMTDEQKKYVTDRWGINENFDFEIDPDWGKYFVELGDVLSFIDWCYENHLDINGLIPKGLSLDATGLNIY
jgi:hypothetical protein